MPTLENYRLRPLSFLPGADIPTVDPYLQLDNEVEVLVNTTGVSIVGLTYDKDSNVKLVADLNGTVVSTDYHLTVNGNNTLTNYYTQLLSANGASPAGVRVNTSLIASTDLATDNSLAMVDIKLTSDGYFTYQSQSSRDYNQANGIDLNDWVVSSTFTIASMTQLDVIGEGTNQVGAGSLFQLYSVIPSNEVENIDVLVATTQVDVILPEEITKEDLYEIECSFNYDGIVAEWIFMYANDNTTPSNYYNQYLTASNALVESSRPNASMIARVDTGTKTQTKSQLKLTQDGKMSLITKTVQGVGSSVVKIWDYVNSSVSTFTSITKLNFIAEKTNGIEAGGKIQLWKKTAAQHKIEVLVATTQVDFVVDYNVTNEIQLDVDWINPSGTSGQLDLYINDNNIASNYYRQRLEADGSAQYVSRDNHSQIGWTSSSIYNKSYIHLKLKLTNSGYLNFQAESVQYYGTSLVMLAKRYGASTFTMASLTKISVYSVDQLGVGSEFYLRELTGGA